MPLQSQFHFLPLYAIIIDREARQRRQLDVSDLLASIARRGIMNPLIVEPLDKWVPGGPQQYKLVAGERRYEAARQLDLSEVPCRLTTELTPTEFAILEFEENDKRSDLTWQDKAKAVFKIHQLLLLDNPGQSVVDTAEALGISQTQANRQITLVPWLGRAEAIDRAGNIVEAINWLARKKEREQGLKLEELIGAGPSLDSALTFEDHLDAMNAKLPEAEVEAELDLSFADPVPASHAHLPQTFLQLPLPVALPKTSPDGIIQGNAIKWWTAYAGPKFNLIHCDFPYGIRLGAGPQGREGGNASQTGDAAYDDEPDTAFALLDSFLQHLNNFTAFSAHLVFWFGGQHRQLIFDKFTTANTGFNFYPHPLIWHKTDNVGILADPQRRPRHTYEQAFLAARGDRKLVCVRADSYAAPTDKSLHHSAKPEPVLRHFFQMLVDETTSLLDPTCGAGSALRAAESLGAKSSFGIELDPKNAEIAQFALRRARNIRAAERALREAEQRKEANG